MTDVVPLLLNIAVVLLIVAVIAMLYGLVMLSRTIEQARLSLDKIDRNLTEVAVDLRSVRDNLGLSLRDWLAGRAMSAMISAPSDRFPAFTGVDDIAGRSFQVADAMIKARTEDAAARAALEAKP